RSNRSAFLIPLLVLVVAALGGGVAIAQSESPSPSAAPSVLETAPPTASAAPSETTSAAPSVAQTVAPSEPASAAPSESPVPSGSPAPTTKPVACKQGTQGGDPYSRITQIVADVSPSVVTVFTDQAQGSGVIVSANGEIVTNNHVATSGNNLQVAL